MENKKSDYFRDRIFLVGVADLTTYTQSTVLQLFIKFYFVLHTYLYTQIQIRTFKIIFAILSYHKGTNKNIKVKDKKTS